VNFSFIASVIILGVGMIASSLIALFLALKQNESVNYGVSINANSYAGQPAQPFANPVVNPAP